MDLSKLSQAELMARCTWCHKRLSQDEECFGAGGRATPEAKAMLGEYEGKLFPMRLSTGRDLIVIVPAPDSPARAEGHDFYLQACSEACCAKATAAIRAELPGKN